MADITDKCKKIIQELETNIKNPVDLETAKNGVYDLLESFLQEIEQIQEISEQRVNRLIQNQSELDRRLSTIEKDIYEEEGELELACPYCNHSFIVDYSDMKKEIKCPECNNVIELDWEEEHDCDCCHGECDDDCGCGCDDGCDCNDYIEDEDDDM